MADQTNSISTSNNTKNNNIIHNNDINENNDNIVNDNTINVNEYNDDTINNVDNNVNNNYDNNVDNNVNNIDDITPLHHWTEPNVQTLRSYKISLARSSYIYRYVLDKKKSALNKILVASLLASTFNTLISGLSTMALTIDNKYYVYFSLATNVALFILSAMIAIVNGAIKIYKLDDLVGTYSTYIEKIDQMFSIVSNQLVLPPLLREDAIDFIRRESKNYLELMKSSPNLDASDEEQAARSYEKLSGKKSLHSDPTILTDYTIII